MDISLFSVADGRLQDWMQWQLGVVAVLRMDFKEVLHQINLDEVDWDSWRSLYEQGRTPRAAVDRAMERDF